MAKIFHWSWMFLTSLLILSACGEGEDSTSAEDDDQIELTMYSWRTEDRQAYETIIEAFEDQHPNISVDFQPYESTEYNTILTNSLVSGSGPDIVQLRPYSGAETIADNGYLSPLDDVDGVSDIDDDYLDAARGSDGNIYGVPLTLNSGVIFYNENLFEEYGLDVPSTYDELIQVSELLQENEITPIAQGGRDAYLLSMVHGVIAPSVYGGNDLVDDIVDGEADLTDPRFLDSLDRLEELSQFFPEDFIALDDNDAQALFYNEEAAMYINGDYRLETFENNIPDMPVGVIPSLELDDGSDSPVMTWVDGSYGVVEESENQEEALLFMEFMATQEFGQLFTDEFNRLNPIEGVSPSHDTVELISDSAEESSTPYLMLVHFGNGSPTTKTIFEDSLQGMFLDEISKEELLEEAQENVERAAEEETEELEMIDEEDGE